MIRILLNDVDFYRESQQTLWQIKRRISITFNKLFMKNKTPEERKREYEANDFALKLLMPEYKFVKIFEKYKGNTKKIADIFGVSIRACEVRAFNLGLIDSL